MNQQDHTEALLEANKEIVRLKTCIAVLEDLRKGQAEEIGRLRGVLIKIRACNYPPLDETQRTCFDLCQDALKQGEATHE